MKENNKKTMVFRIMVKENTMILADETFNSYEVSIPMTYEEFLKCDSEDKPRKTFPVITTEPGGSHLTYQDDGCELTFNDNMNRLCIVESRTYRLLAKGEKNPRRIEASIVYYSSSTGSDIAAYNNVFHIKNIYMYSAESILMMMIDTIEKIYKPSMVFDKGSMQYFKTTDTCVCNNTTYVNEAVKIKLDATINELMDKNKILENYKKACSEKMEKMQNELTETRAQKVNMSAEIDRLVGKIDLLERDKSKSSETAVEGDNLRYKGVSYIKYAKYREMNTSLSSQIDELNKDKISLEKKLSKEQSSREEIMNKYNDLKSMNSNLYKSSAKGVDTTELDAKIKSLEDEDKRNKAIIAELEEAINGDTSKISPAVVNDLRAQIESLNDQIAKTEKTNKELSDRNTILEQWYDEYTTDSDEDSAPITQDDIDNLDIIYTEKQKAVERAYATLEDLDNRIVAKRAELRNVGKEKKSDRDSVVEEAATIASNTKKEEKGKRKYVRRSKEEIEKEKLMKETLHEIRKRLHISNRANIQKAIASCDPKLLDGLDLTLIK